MNPPLTIGNGTWGPKATVTGEWSIAVEDCIRSKDIKELELNHAKGWRGADVRFLERLTGLTVVHAVQKWGCWAQASGDFALGARGRVDVGGVARENSMWRSIEKPALENNPAVLSIRVHLSILQ